MKAERRHELHENSLARFIAHFPGFWARHGNKILIAVILVAGAVVLYRYRQSTILESRRAASESLEQARADIATLMIAPAAAATQPVQAMAQIKETASGIGALLDAVAGNASNNPAQVAQALALRGDLYWQLANLPELPGAATQPAAQLPQSSADYLTRAAEAYQGVLNNYPNQPQPRVAALFGLAAIAENRGQFDEAKAFYQQVVESSVLEVYKDFARHRIDLLPQMQKPLFLGDFGLVAADPPATDSSPATLPASAPANP